MADLMDISSVVNDYFVKPLWNHEGYNIVNTLTYAAVALGALYVLWKLFEKHKVKIDGAFWAAVIAWSFWGSSIRVLTDSIDQGTMARTLTQALTGAGGLFDPIARAVYPAILGSHVLDYGWATVTPGIYIVTAALFLCSLLLSRKLGRPYWAAWVGGLGAALNLMLLLPMAVNWTFAAVPVLLTLGVGALLWFGLKWREPMAILPVMAQSLDGAATWTTIDWFGPAMHIPYFEQHVVSSAIGGATPLGYGLFFLIKVGFTILAVRALMGKKMDGVTEWVADRFREMDAWITSVLDKTGKRSASEVRELLDSGPLSPQLLNLALLVFVVIGLAPGLRDLLRMLCGT